MRHETVVEVKGPWSLTTSKRFWEGFAPQALPTRGETEEIRTVFRSEFDWLPVEAVVTQEGASTRIVVSGDGDLDAAAGQVARFLALDIDASAWPEVGLRDPVIADAQERLPGLRPCGFHSPYEAAAWAVLSQRIRIVQAAKLREELIREHGDGGAFPAPERLAGLDLDLPGRKTEYLHSVAEAALEGRLDGVALRSIDPQDAIARVQEVKGLGPFAAELVVIRGANAPDVLPSNEGRLTKEIAARYGEGRTPTEVAEAWRPFRAWASVHLRVMREARTHEIAGG
jgi:DNA-3-methyladenine glycosylase II